VVGRILVNRGVKDVDGARAFLEPKFKDLHRPELLPQMGRAVERIVGAIKGGEKITIYGDYDVDGVTGSAMLWHMLKEAGATVESYIPHRVEEGYGLNVEAIDSLADGGTKLLITVDCGCSAMGPIARARQRGMDVVVTDHHEFAPEMPEVCAMVHPRRHPKDSEGGPEYPNPDLCGAGVAYKLAWALAMKLCNGERVSEGYRQLLVEFAALAALGTVADVVPLVGENRILVKYGLGQLMRTRFAGLGALVSAAGYGVDRKVDSVAIGFTLAPRLNAAGRMGHAREAFELLTSAEGTRAQEIATWLEQQNRQRQTTERKMAEIAREQIENRKLKIEKGAEELVLVAADESFHAGVVGIVASRLVDLYHRPAFVLHLNSTECHGSARSIEGFEVHEAIAAARDLLISGGGHAMAGGVRLLAENLEAFRERVNAYARGRLKEEQLVPALKVDGCLDLGECDVALVEWIEKMEPFGRGNPQPRFVIENVRLSAPPRRVGATGAHLQLTVARGAAVARAIAFRMGAIEPELPIGTEVSLVVEPQLEEWQGRKRVGLVVADMAKVNDEPLGVVGRVDGAGG
jgi:single-stranded-DNA-specific exonuclease